MVLNSISRISVNYIADFTQIVAFVRICEPFLAQSDCAFSHRFLGVVANASADWPQIGEFLAPIGQFYGQK